jgi:hypothetical protein
MGVDSIIKLNNPDWDNNVNSIYINNNICRSFKEINRSLEKDFTNERLKRELEKSSPNFKRISEEEKRKIKMRKEEERKSKRKFHNDKYI